MRHRDIERQLRDRAEFADERVRHYAEDVSGKAQSMLQRGRRRINDHFGRRSGQYARQLSHKAEDFADEANYQYHRMRRQVRRHPAATVAIALGTIGAFMLLRRMFRSDEED